MTDVGRQYDDLKIKYERTEWELLGKIRDLEQKYNDKERESLTTLTVLRDHEREIDGLIAENRRLRGELDNLHGDYSERMQRAEKAKKSHLV